LGSAGKRQWVGHKIADYLLIWQLKPSKQVSGGAARLLISPLETLVSWHGLGLENFLDINTSHGLYEWCDVTDMCTSS
jgi:hypothetical protein